MPLDRSPGRDHVAQPTSTSSARRRRAMKPCVSTASYGARPRDRDRRSAASCGTSRGAGRCPRGRGRRGRPARGAALDARPRSSRPSRTRRRGCPVSWRNARAAALPAARARRHAARRPAARTRRRALALEELGDVLAAAPRLAVARRTPRRTNATIGTPQSRCREMHQSGRVLDHAADALAAPRRASSARGRSRRAPGRAARFAPSPMNHCSVARKMIGFLQRQQCG